MIGVLGCSGAVGGHAAQLLHRCGAGPLRLGGRSVGVDATDDSALRAFVSGCAIVVNCAGPSHVLAERIAVAALDAGAAYVDAGGNEPLVERLSPVTGRSAVLFAGALPGLSGLLPKWLARQGFDAVHTLVGYTGVLDRFTRAGAEDFLHGLSGGPRPPARRIRVRLPFFAGEVSAVPYRDAETEGVARDLSLQSGQWSSVREGGHLDVALDRAGSIPRPDAVAELCRASALDLMGRTPSVTFLVQLGGTVSGRQVVRTAVLRATGIAELSGAVAAAATLATLHGEVPPGAYRAATVLDPERTVGRLREAGALSELSVHDGTIGELAVVEDGVL